MPGSGLNKYASNPCICDDFLFSSSHTRFRKTYKQTTQMIKIIAKGDMFEEKSMRTKSKGMIGT